MSLLQHFSAPNSSFGSVHFGCGAKMPQSLTDACNDGKHLIHWHQIKPNRSDELKMLLENIQNNHGPIKAVVFDRFYAEEAFSFRIREMCPNALLVLDMQDIHSLRLGRQCLVEEATRSLGGGNGHVDSNASRDHLNSMTSQLMDNVMEFDPSSNTLLFNDDGSKSKKKAHDAFLRELSSVHRSDLVLVCSSVEMKLLESWNVPKWKLVPASFFCIDIDDTPEGKGEIKSLFKNVLPKSYNFEQRRDFAIVGGFKHAPNVDSVKLLRYEIWPRIRDQLPHARMHIYGAYPTPQILSMHDENSGFIVHGQVDDLDKVLLESRVMLAPLRYGAGCKGKIVDAWRCGCPVVTTPVGAEGMTDAGQSENGGRWGGMIASDIPKFVDAAIEVYTQKDLWRTCQDNGTSLLNKLFNGRVNLPLVEDSIHDAIIGLRKRRQLDFIGALLWRGSQRSTEYFSKWIELKEKLR
ncbi:hypothetical protein ACHAXR_007758 [Thalassiosira sp. AJA248-18]